MKSFTFITLGYLALVAGCCSNRVSDPLTLVSPHEGAEIATLTAGQKAFFDKPREERIRLFADAETRRQMIGAGWQNPCVLHWTGGTAPFTVSVSRADNGAAHWSGLVTNDTKEIFNLEIARDYVWQVTDAAGQTSQGHFTTEGRGPRFLSFLGPYNCRDFGGWVGLGGRRVRQGQAFRTAGLNDNSSTGFTTEEEGRARDTDGLITALEKTLKDSLQGWETRRPEDIKLVSAQIPTTWRVWRRARPKPFEDLALLLKTPESPEAEEVSVDEAFGLDLHGIGEGWAVLEATLTAEESGYVLLGCGADWYWALAINGLPVRDRLAYGNRRVPHSIDNHLVCVPVQKGENTLRVLLGAGTTGFKWFCGKGRETSREKILETERNYVGWLVKKLWVRSSGLKVGSSRVSESERRRWVERYGVKTELDLRTESETLGMTGSPLGPEVEWIRISSPAYQNMTNATGRAAMKDIFKVIFDESKYPLVFHCIGGRDRTGTVSFLMNGLLGVSEEDLYYDWEGTGFCQTGTDFQHRNCITPLVRSLNNYPGETLNDRIVAYIKSLGFTDEDIERFRERMLE